MNVFGRDLSGTSKVTALGGRDHVGNHAVMVMIGKNVAPGLTGGTGLITGSVYGATGINSTTGASMTTGGDIAQDDTAVSVAVVARALAIEVKAAPAESRQRSKPGINESCPYPSAGDLDKIVRGELLTRVGGCVARDGPLDPQWDMVNSAVLSLGVCLDCRRARDEQVTQCRRAHDVLQRATQSPR